MWLVELSCTLSAHAAAPGSGQKKFVWLAGLSCTLSAPAAAPASAAADE